MDTFTYFSFSFDREGVSPNDERKLTQWVCFTRVSRAIHAHICYRSRYRIVERYPMPGCVSFERFHKYSRQFSRRGISSRYRAPSVTPSITSIIERLLGRASSTLNDLIKESRLRDSNGRTKGRPTSHPNDSRTLSRGKGLSWPANGTDLCGLGRRLSVCKKISLASARAPWLIRVCPPNPVPACSVTSRVGKGGWQRRKRHNENGRERQVGRETQCGRGSWQLGQRGESRGIFLPFFYSFHSPLSPFSFLLFFLFFLHFRTMSKSNVVTLFVHPRICRDFQEIDANFCIFEQLCTVSKRSRLVSRSKMLIVRWSALRMLSASCARVLT